ncbi:MAG: hypothetical protein RLZZ440_1846 [Planctomycetota bacterium]
MSESMQADSPPDDDPLRRRIAREAGRGVIRGSDARRATFRAARRVARDWVPDDQIPAPAEVRDEAHRQLDPAGSLARLVGDRFDQLAALAAVLATVKQDPERHPEGDALEHSLQVFDLVWQEHPCDEELLTAALVHDVGRAVDRRNPVAATLAAVEGLVTPRTRWLIESLPAGRAYVAGTIGFRARRRLERDEDIESILCLAEADRRGCLAGYAAPTLDEAIAILRDVETTSDDVPF